MGKNTTFLHTFYVYQYATGYSAAIAISTKILAGDEQVIAGYRKVLVRRLFNAPY